MFSNEGDVNLPDSGAENPQKMFERVNKWFLEKQLEWGVGMLNIENVILGPDEFNALASSVDGFVDKSYSVRGLTAFISGGKRYILANDAFNKVMCEWGDD